MSESGEPRPSRPSDLSSALRRYLGYPSFRPGQEDLVKAALQGRDALGILPTGGGKSVCFQLPAFLLGGVVLVVSPLISLMADQVERAREAGLRADLLNSALSGKERREVRDRALHGSTQLLLVSPERLELPAFRKLLQRLALSLLAVDEAHCISQWGHDFRPSYLRIGAIRPVVRAPILALTATATPRVRREISALLRLRRPVEVVGTFDRPNLSWAVRAADTHAAKMGELRALVRSRGGGAAVVYASTRRTVEAVRRGLAGLGLPAMAYHAGLTDGGRETVQRRFMGDAAPLVVATNAFGMGIDRSDVRLVAHYQLPGSLEAYYQEAGRAGRDGRPARCVALHGDRDRSIHDRFVARAHPHPNLLRRAHAVLRERLSPGVAATIGFDVFQECLPPGSAEGEVRILLAALERCGSILLRESRATSVRSAASSIGSTEESGISVLLRSSPPDFGRLAVLRRAAFIKVEAVAAYAREKRCRRKAILAYFGERGRGGTGCGGCDLCRRRRERGLDRRLAGMAALFTGGGTD